MIKLKGDKIMDNMQYNEALSALRAEYEAKLAEKEAENALLKAKKKTEDEAREKSVAQAQKQLEEYVSVKLFKDGDKYRDNVYVAVNGENCIIKRGEWVRIKRKFAMVLDQSEIQDIKTAALIESEQNKFAEESRKAEA